MKYTKSIIEGISAVIFLLLSATAQADAECQYENWRQLLRRYPSNEASPPTLAQPLKIGKPIDVSKFLYQSILLKKNASLDEYVESSCVIGLMLLKDGLVVYENYFHGWRPEMQYLSASVSKTVLSLIVGIAIAEGKLSLATKVVDIFPDYKSSAFGEVTVEELLRMTAGVKLVNNYIAGAASDNQATNPIIEPNQNIYQYLKEKSAVTAGAPKVFEYNGAISAMLGLVLTKAIGQTATSYLEEKVWQPIGAEDKAYWIKNRRGEEGVQGQFFATLRDYAKIGLLISENGKAHGLQVVPAPWIAQMTTLSKEKAQPLKPPYYGLHIWLPTFKQGSSQAMGTNGQFIYIDPRSRIVIVQTAAQKSPVGPQVNEFFPFRNAIVEELEKHVAN